MPAVKSRSFASIVCLTALAAAQSPFVFEPAAPGAFVARRPGMQVQVDAGGAELALANGRTLAVRLDGSGAVAVAEHALPGRSHYLVGADRGAWRRDVPHFARVRCTSAWPGVDVLWYARDGVLEYDLVFAPGAAPERAAVSFGGADRVDVRADGSVALTVGDLEIVQRTTVEQHLVGG